MEVETKDQFADIYNYFFYATICHVCKRFTDDHLMVCGGCKMIAYCGKQHQKQHWKQHKSLCRATQEVLQRYNIDDRGVSSEDWDNMKMNLMVLVSFELKRNLALYEMQMFKFPRECAVCHDRNGQSLEDCQRCASSFCEYHNGSFEHTRICVPLELCLRSNLSFMRRESGLLDLHYLQRVCDTNAFRDMNDFINTYLDIQAHPEVSYDVLAVSHSQYLTRPLTVFYAMRLLSHVPERKDLVLHVIAANLIEEVTLAAWEILLHLLGTVMSLVIVMIGPELRAKSNQLWICDSCTSRGKTCTVEFLDMLYESYVQSPVFVKPDLVIGFNTGIHEQAFASIEDTWMPSIRLLAKQNCPFVLTSYTRQESKEDTDRINTILDKKIECFCSGRNPFASLRPHRSIGPEKVFFENHYIVVYMTLCPLSDCCKSCADENVAGTEGHELHGT